MLKPFHKSRKKSTAQAMVEFALALPILLLVVYGLIESGRLLFIYASVVTAARQAVRYGAATGLNGSGTAYYQDCAGIRTAAKQVGFIQALSDSNIAISYDAGLDLNGDPISFTGSQAGNASCSQGASPSNIQNGWRIKVAVTTQYAPIVPLVPLRPFSISSTSTRTLLASIAIGVTSPPQTWAGSGGIILTVSPSSGTYTTAGQVITYTFSIQNTGTTDITTPYTITDNVVGSINCSGATSPLPPGASTTCTGTYTITQANLDSGSITSTSSASANTYVSNNVITTITALQSPSMTIIKTPSTSAAGTVGQTVTYTYTLKNTGNVTLTSPFAVTDNKIASVSCSAIGSSLAPNASGNCTGSYSITSADVTNGAVVNTANATAKFSTQTINAGPVSATVVTRPVYLTITASPLIATGINQTVTYTYYLKNTTSSSLSSPYTITDSKVTSINCSGATSPLAPGATTSCTGTYLTTQADVDAGVVQTVVSATAKSGASIVTSNTVNTSVTVTRTPQITLSIVASPTMATTAGAIVSYTYTILNSGNTTLTSPFAITDDKVASTDCSGAASPLAPGASTTCTGSYTITQTDIDVYGSVINRATATGNSSGLTVTSNQASAIVITYNAPRLSLQKTASPSTASMAGQSITYTYTLQNTGNTPLSAPFTVTDDKTTVSCTGAVSPIPVGGSTTCTSTYTITAQNVLDGSVTNNATAKAKAGSSDTNTATASATVTITAPVACDPRHSSLTTSPFRMTVFNYSPSSTITISQIQIYYNTASSQTITTLTYGGSAIWNGSASGSPATFISFTGPVTLTAGSNKLLSVSFGKNYATNGTERILITFAESGCPVLDSGNSGQLP